MRARKELVEGVQNRSHRMIELWQPVDKWEEVSKGMAKGGSVRFEAIRAEFLVDKSPWEELDKADWGRLGEDGRGGRGMVL